MMMEIKLIYIIFQIILNKNIISHFYRLFCGTRDCTQVLNILGKCSSTLLLTYIHAHPYLQILHCHQLNGVGTFHNGNVLIFTETVLLLKNCVIQDAHYC
jgi:hypothetical protein